MSCVDSIGAEGESGLVGDVTVSAGDGIQLTQVGQDIEVSLIPDPPFSPADITGLQGWYDAEDDATFTIVSNKVSAWDDKSGNGFTLTQGNATFRPLYNGTPRTINGVICPEFTGAQEFMDSSCPADDRTSTTFAAFLIDNLAAIRVPVADSVAGGNELRIAANGTFQTLKSGDSVLANLLVINSGYPTAICQRLTATTVEHFTASSGGTANNATAFTAGRTLRIGLDSSGAQVFDGLIAEVIRYSATLNDADTQAVLNYLAAKWMPQ